MKKLLSILFCMIFLVLLLVVGAGVAGYFYLKSDAVKNQLEQVVSKHTTTPVTIESLGITLSGITMEGLVVPNEAPLTDNFLDTRAFGVELQWLSLLEEIPAIDALRIGQPSLALHQSAEGGMRLPLKGAGDGTGTEPESSTTANLDLMLNVLEVKDGRFVAYDPAGEPLIQVKGLSLTGDVKRVAGDWKLASLLSTSEIIAGSYLTITGATSPLTMVEKKIALPELEGTFYGGALDGETQVDLNPDDPAFTFALKGTGTDMDLMMQSFGKEAGFMQGKLDLALTGEGNASAPKDLQGEGNFTIAPAIMPKLKVAKALGDILGVKLIQDGTFQEVKGTFTLHDQLVDFSQLEVISENVSVELTGTVGFDTQLNLKGNVILQPGATEVFSKLFGGTADQIRAEVREIPLTITGPSSDPNVDVDTIQVGLDAGKSLLNRFLFKPGDVEEGTPPDGPKPISDDPVEAVDSILKGFLGN